jgi:hypothetical protein
MLGLFLPTESYNDASCRHVGNSLIGLVDIEWIPESGLGLASQDNRAEF